MSPADQAVFEDVLRRPHGLVLLTGPTGSGKTTTLYAAIQELLKGEREEPSEAVRALGITGHCGVMIASAVEIVEKLLQEEGK